LKAHAYKRLQITELRTQICRSTWLTALRNNEYFVTDVLRHLRYSYHARAVSL